MMIFFFCIVIAWQLTDAPTGLWSSVTPTWWPPQPGPQPAFSALWSHWGWSPNAALHWSYAAPSGDEQDNTPERVQVNITYYKQYNKICQVKHRVPSLQVTKVISQDFHIKKACWYNDTKLKYTLIAKTWCEVAGVSGVNFKSTIKVIIISGTFFMYLNCMILWDQ